jgi:hypothetical protein
MAKTEAIEQELVELSKKQAGAKPEDRNAILDLIEERQKQLRRMKQIGPFKYSHQGSLAYIGADKAVADVSWFAGNLASGGTLTYLFWKSAYLSMCFSSKYFKPPLPPVDEQLTINQHATDFWCCLTGQKRISSDETYLANECAAIAGRRAKQEHATDCL